MWVVEQKIKNEKEGECERMVKRERWQERGERWREKESGE